MFKREKRRYVDHDQLIKATLSGHMAKARWRGNYVWSDNEFKGRLLPIEALQHTCPQPFPHFCRHHASPFNRIHIFTMSPRFDHTVKYSLIFTQSTLLIHSKHLCGK